MKPAIIDDCLALPGQERKQARAARAAFICGLGCLAATAATGLATLFLPMTFFLGLALYYRLGSADSLAPPDLPPSDSAGNHGGICNGPSAPLAGAARDGFTPITFHNRREYRFATAGNEGKLVIGAGTIRGEMKMEFRPERGEGEEMDTVVCSLRLADATGHTWESRLLMLPYLLTDPIEPGAKLPAGGFRFCDDAPPAWREALAHNCLISGVHNLLDTRDAGELAISGTPHRIYFKQQEPLVDVAYLDASAMFIVRISRLHHDISTAGTFAGSSPIPPFCYAVPAEDLLFMAAPHHYYSYHDEWYAMEEGIKKREPHFTSLYLLDAPHPLVRHLPGEPPLQ
jgi:hypothetical protein